MCWCWTVVTDVLKLNLNIWTSWWRSIVTVVSSAVFWSDQLMISSTLSIIWGTKRCLTRLWSQTMEICWVLACFSHRSFSRQTFWLVTDETNLDTLWFGAIVNVTDHTYVIDFNAAAGFRVVTTLTPFFRFLKLNLWILKTDYCHLVVWRVNSSHTGGKRWSDLAVVCSLCDAFKCSCRHRLWCPFQSFGFYCFLVVSVFACVFMSM